MGAVTGPLYHCLGDRGGEQIVIEFSGANQAHNLLEVKGGIDKMKTHCIL